jgi:hypothetical protein
MLLTGGNFCGTPGSDTVDGPCAVGYYCEYGVDTSTPNSGTAHLGVGDMCPAGTYCPLGTELPIPCPAGTFTATAGKGRTSLISLFSLFILHL